MLKRPSADAVPVPGTLAPPLSGAFQYTSCEGEKATANAGLRLAELSADMAAGSAKLTFVGTTSTETRLDTKVTGVVGVPSGAAL